MPQGREQDNDSKTQQHHRDSLEDTLLEETASLATNFSELETRELKNDQALEGRQLGHYDIRSFLGKGNMAVVYLAYDNVLERNVALKLLPSEHTLDERRLRLFRQEAKAASALNHPNVITIHEVGEAGGAHFIATEYIEGRTLRELMVLGNLPVDEKLRIATEIGKALDVTHRKGVVHGDVKPENTMIRPDGLVKVLDFGLARLMRSESAPTEHLEHRGHVGGAEATHKGGTPRYMSPEQVRGEGGDARSDIFSLGVLIYEMCANTPPFSGDTIRDLFDAILNQEPKPLKHALKSAPTSLCRTIDRALRKTPGERYQTASEMLADLEKVRVELAQPPWWKKYAKSLVVGLVLAGVLAIVFWKVVWPLIERDTPTHISTLDKVKIGDGLGISQPSFSPDGQKVAYSKTSEGSDNIWIMTLGNPEPRQVTFKGNLDRGPIWSQDGKELAFISARDGWYGIWSVATSGGTPTRIAPLSGPGTALCRWSKDGKLIYFQMAANLYQVEKESGFVKPLTDLGASSAAHDFAVSPDESKISYSRSVGNNRHIFVSPKAADKPTQVTSGESTNIESAWYHNNRELAYISIRTGPPQIFKVAITGGKETRVSPDDLSYESVSVSPTEEKLAAVSTDSKASISSCDLQGIERSEQPGTWGNPLLFPEVSNQAGKIVFQASPSVSTSQGELRVARLDGKYPPEKIVDKGFEAKWSPDGSYLAFLVVFKQMFHLYSQNMSENVPKLLASGVDVMGTTRVPLNRIRSNFSWSPDGKQLCYASAAKAQEPNNIWVVSRDGATRSAVTQNEHPDIRHSSPIWSQDGTSIAFVRSPRDSTASGKSEIAVLQNGITTTVLQERWPPRLLGWSSSGTEVLVAVGSIEHPSPPQTVRLERATAKGRSALTSAPIESAYLHSFKLSPDARRIAFVHRVDGKDSISVVDLQNERVVRLTQSNDPGIFFSGLTWSSDGSKVFFSRQDTEARLVLIEKPPNK